MSSIDASTLLGAGADGYQIERSLRFSSASSKYLNRTPASAGNRKTWSVSFWLKRSALGTYQMPFSCYQSTGGALALIFNTDNTLEFYQYNAAYQMRLVTSQVFRDPSSWYHFVFSVDTTQATASNRVKIYVNGTQITAFSTATYPTQNDDLIFNYAQAHAIGMYAGNNQYYFDGLITEFHNIDGQALTPSSFGETDTITGVWKPKRYSGTYGTNGFKLTFSDNSGTTSTTLGKDSSGNGNNWTPNNFSVTAGAGNDSLIDVPTPYADGGNGRGNYCTWNPLAVNPGACTFANGNLDVTTAGVGGNAFGTFAIPTSGKWYWEVVCTTGNNPLIGIAAYSSSTTYGFQNTNAVGYYLSGQKYVDAVASAYGSSYTTQIIGVAADADAGTITFYRDNVSQGSITHAVAGLFPTVSDGSSATTDTFVVNFGQRAFAYTPPSGFKALNTQNLPEPSIKKPSSYFDAKLYTGNGSTQTISGFDFSPDLVWIKSRSAATNNDVFDSVRGATVGFATNSTQAESTFSGVTAFNSNGFSLGSNTSDNANSATYVAWCWDESATPGFDIVTYTGDGVTSRTISHSLGVTPAWIVIKQRNSVSDWETWHKSLGSGLGLRLNTTSAQITLSATSGGGISSSPTSSVFSFTSGTAGVNNVNANTATYVAYLWSEVAGFSKFGSYTGNGSSDGPFVFCGFRPRWVLAKRSDASAYNWFIFDAARSPENVSDEWLLPNGSNAEQAQVVADMVSNGFKIRSSLSEFNINGGTYIFAAFAESPFKYSLAR